MKSIFKILVLGVVPVLAVTAVVDQGLAADKGSQLLFIADTGVNMRSYMADMDMEMMDMSVSGMTGVMGAMQKNFISITNTAPSGNPEKKRDKKTTVAGRAVTVLFQYYNDEAGQVLSFLRVLRGGETVLIDPFDHMIPGSAQLDADDMEIPGTTVNVADHLFGDIPAMTIRDAKGNVKTHGFNSGRFIIAVTAVGGNTQDDAKTKGKVELNRNHTADILFPEILAEDMHKVDNIDAIGFGTAGEVYIGNDVITDPAGATPSVPADTGLTASTTTTPGDENAVKYGVNYAQLASLGFADHDFGLGADNNPDTTSSEMEEYDTLVNVSDLLTYKTAEPISFNHLTGHHTVAQESTVAGGSDQSAAWAVSALARTAVDHNGKIITTDYQILNGLGHSVSLTDNNNTPTDSTDDPTAKVKAYLFPTTVVNDVAVPVTVFPFTPKDQTANTPNNIRRLPGRLAEKGLGGAGGLKQQNVSGYRGKQSGENTMHWDVNPSTVTGKLTRFISGGGAVWSSLHGTDHQNQMVNFLSVADRFDRVAAAYVAPEDIYATAPDTFDHDGDTDTDALEGGYKYPATHAKDLNTVTKPGGYKLIAAKTGLTVNLYDNQGDALSPTADDDPVFGGGTAATEAPGFLIIVEGLEVMTAAKKCKGTKIDGAWSLADLTSLYPEAAAGDAEDFDGLDAMVDPAMNASLGWVRFARAGLSCTENFGDGDVAEGSSNEDADGVPTKDERTYTGGTLVAEKEGVRTFVTAGQAVLRHITPNSTFGASWWLASPPAK